MPPDPSPAELHLGTSSWSSADWVASGFYPADLPAGKYLPHYAGRTQRHGDLITYDTVEVDSTWYRLPSAALCQKWKRDTPPGFRFALKVTQSITHDPVLVGEAEKDFERFMGAAEELGERLGFVLFQFGYFNRQSACPDLGSFLKRLAAFSRLCPPRHNYVVEVRNKQWVGKDLLAALKDHRFALALTDQQWMPRPGPLWEKFGSELLTRDFAYVRFLGERERIEKIVQERGEREKAAGQEVTPEWSQVVIDRTPEVGEWITILHEVIGRLKIPAWAWFNNHWSGHAPAAIEHFRSLWEAGR
jgi:uncharacterized protein YecE (DUF72 family)